MESNKIYAFLYNSCIHESSYATISVHRTREGAHLAMNTHKNEKLMEYEEYKKRHIKSTEKYCKKEKLDEVATKMLIERISPFGAHEDWAIEEIELLD